MSFKIINISSIAAICGLYDRVDYAAAKAAAIKTLALAEGLAVGALIHGGVGLVGAHQDPVQRAEIVIFAVVCALGNGAFNALVGFTIHCQFLLFRDRHSMLQIFFSIRFPVFLLPRTKYKNAPMIGIAKITMTQMSL